MTWSDEAEKALEFLWGMWTYAEIYDYIKKNSTRNLPPNRTAAIRGAIEKNSTDSKAFDGRNDIFYSVEWIGKGVWWLTEYMDTPREEDIEFINKKLDDYKEASKEEKIRKLSEEIERGPSSNKRRLYLAIARNYYLSTRVKEHRKYICQWCGIKPFEKGAGWFYVEAHHMHELGEGGKDVIENIVCLCPNCHRKIHYGRKEIHDEIVNNIKTDTFCVIKK